MDAWKVLYKGGADDVMRTSVEALNKMKAYLNEGFTVFKKGDGVYIKQADGTEIGRLDMNDPYNRGELKVKATHSGRYFDPHKAGGAIQKLDWKNAVIDKTGIEKVKQHLGRLDPDPWNEGMIKRLEDIEMGKIKATDFDKRFYTHETREFERYTNLGYKTQKSEEIPDWVWDNAHAATLEDYIVKERIEFNGEVVKSLYHPSVQK